MDAPVLAGCLAAVRAAGCVGLPGDGASETTLEVAVRSSGRR